ncbi:MAG: MoaD/ThiS family protein [Anaerolineaceae bacterium]|nr:MoaD/ThiS family protein [Anaerolineaceae bacterium]
MNIDIEVFGQLIQNKQRRRALEVMNPTLIRDVVNMLGLKEEEIGLITVDGVQSEPEDLVHPGSRLCFFPPMSGG